MKTRRLPSRLGRALLTLAVAAGVLALIGYRSARADPVVRRMTVKLPGWPAGATPVTVALLSDIHIGSPATPPARLARIVAQVNALRPDLVLIAGDFVAGHDAADGPAFAAQLRRSLTGLRAPLGTVAVLGNHDHWMAADTIAHALRAAGITVLANQATARGPLAVIGVDDGFSGRADIARSLAAARQVAGARLVLTHTPDTTVRLPRAAGALLLAGHTHCGQAVLPWIGSLAFHRFGESLYLRRYECDAVRDPDRLVIVTGGIGGTLPLRYGAPPDLWLLTLGP